MPRGWLKHADRSWTSTRSRRFVKPHNCSCGKGHGTCGAGGVFTCAPPNTNKVTKNGYNQAVVGLPDGGGLDSRGRFVGRHELKDADHRASSAFDVLSEAELQSIHGEEVYCVGCAALGRNPCSSSAPLYEDLSEPGSLYCSACWKKWNAAHPQQEEQAGGERHRGSRNLCRTDGCLQPAAKGPRYSATHGLCTTCTRRAPRPGSSPSAGCGIVEFKFGRSFAREAEASRGWRAKGQQGKAQPVTPFSNYSRPHGGSRL